MASPITSDFQVEEFSDFCCCFSRNRGRKQSPTIRGLRYEVRDSVVATDQSGTVNSKSKLGVVNDGFSLERQNSAADSLNALDNLDAINRIVLFRLPGWAAMAIAAFKERVNREYTMNGVQSTSSGTVTTGAGVSFRLDENGESEGDVVPLPEYKKAQESVQNAENVEPIKNAVVVYAKRSTF